MNTFIALLVVVLLASGQSKADTQYKDFVVAGDFIWGLTTTGTLNLFSKVDGNPVQKVITNQSEIVVIGKDKLDRLLIADSDKTIKYYNEKLNGWEIISTYTSTIFGLVCTTNNEYYAITDKGIEDVKTHKSYYAGKSINYQVRHPVKWRSPFCHYIDKHDNIWVGFGYGEWGGDVFIFNTEKKTFIIPDTGTRPNGDPAGVGPVNSFFEDSTSVYLTSGGQHMMMVGGSIVKFDNFKATTIFSSQSHWSKPEPNIVIINRLQYMIAGEYIGPATYNNLNNSIYFYSQNGLFRGNKTSDLSTMDNWKLIVKPKLQWRSGQPDAVGSPMNVLKVAIIDTDTLLFLSQDDGIGFFRNNTLKMIN